ncbi:MAG: LAGLIDADG family homing endonuclease [Promethearchaeota archaeon]
MKDYNNKEFVNKRYNLKAKNKKEKDEEFFDKKVNSLDRKKDLIKNNYTKFQFNDEDKSDIYQFEMKFKRKENVKENSKKEVSSHQKENDTIKKQLEKIRIKEYLQEQDKNDLEFKENPNEPLVENKELVEMICIGLGDGTIPCSKSEYKITLNESQEPQYIKYVYDLMKKTLKKRPRIFEPKEADAIKLSVHRKKIIEALIKKGHKSGDKKENQIKVPNWIKKNKEFHLVAIRRLVDTDGSIHIHKHNKTLHISFNNASFPLLEDFKFLCKANGIETVKISPVKGKNTFTTGLEAKGNVSKFLYMVKPKKWEYRVETFGLVLKSISDPKKRVKIEKELQRIYKDKRVNYSFKYRDDLEKLCIKYGYDVGSESLIKEIEKMLTYDDNYTGLSKERKKKMNFYGEKIIKDLRQKWK